MFRLIKNELIKIFSKKSTYIFMIIVFVLIFATTKTSLNESMGIDNDFEIMTAVDDVPSEMDTFSVQQYLSSKARAEVVRDIRNKFGKNSWQEYVVLKETDSGVYEKLLQYIQMKVYNEFIEDYKEDLDYYKVNLENIKPEIDEEDAKKSYDEVIELFEENDWKKFANLMIDKEKEELNQVEINRKIYGEKEYEENKKLHESKIEELELRLSKNIKYGYDYLNLALLERRYAKIHVADLEKKVELNYHDKVLYQQEKEKFAKNDYVINTKYDTESIDTVRYRIANALNSGFNGLLIIVSIVAISSSIMSSEFNKDTMKQLAIKPFSRTKIYFSKLITCFIMTILICLFMILANGTSNLVCFGTKTLENPMTIYNFTTSTLMEMGIFKYIGIQFLVNIPIYLGVILISFSLSTMFGNTLAASIIAILIYMGIGQLIVPSTAPGWIANKLLTTNWDFSNYLFGKLPFDDYYSFSYSIIVCLIYYALALFPSLIFFKKGDIGSK